MYLTDEAAHTYGHTVLKLPVAHCELNPIVLTWASVKGYVAKHSKIHNFPDIEWLTPDGFIYTTRSHSLWSMASSILFTYGKYKKSCSYKNDIKRTRWLLWNLEFLRIPHCVIGWYVVWLHTNKLYN